jgi:hypothetical protein
MSKFRPVRSGAVAILAIFGALLLSYTNSASASAVIYSNSNVNVKVTGGDAIAVNNCINDAQDGVIQNQINSCNQVANAGNILQLENSSVWVFGPNCFCGLPLFSASHVTVELTGGLALAINNCINDATDGFIQTQQNYCAQSSTAGNILTLSGVSVVVEQ